MDKDVAIRVENLGKEYIIGHKKSGDLRNSFKDKLSGLFGERQEKESFWALKNINFEIKKGEAVGIIGRNGAGKSTLLKILSRITEPTTGRFEINGRISSLLEVGTGFHMELTGRENIFLNGTILGMKRLEIKQKFDEIVAFSGVEKFLDTPVKHYSSGMKVRLAFSVAAHLEPEILIVDEVLAVGDAEFQKKCLGKMDDVSKEGGRTVIFVSHNMGAVRNLCQNGILLESGELLIKDSIEQTIEKYSLSSNKTDLVFVNKSDDKIANRIVKISLSTKNPSNEINMGNDLVISFDLSISEPMRNGALSYQIRNFEGQNIVHNLILASEQNFGNEEGQISLKNTLKNISLYPGVYTLSAYLADAKTKIRFERLEDILMFEITRPLVARDYYWQKGSAIFYHNNQWEIDN